MPIFCVKSVKIYTGQKKFTWVYPWRPWQISGMVIHITYPHQTHVYKCSCVWQYTIVILSLIFTGIRAIYSNLTVQSTWNIMFKNWCKYTHDLTTMLPKIHNASIFYGTQSVTPDTSTSHMRLAEYSQTKEIHSPHLKHPPWFTGCSKKK